jgi:hypothetical protein
MFNVMRSAMLAGTVLVGSAVAANAFIVTFEDQTGPSLFGNPNQTLVYNFPGVTATFTGGTILTATTNLPADQTSVYGTISTTPNSNPLTITFSAPVTNFFLDILNGETSDETYTIADNVGNTASFVIPPNLNSGLQFFSLAATGTVVTITSAAANGGGFWDFFVDNVGFDQPTPLGTPEPSTWAMMLLGFAGLALAGYRRATSGKQAQSAA